MSVEGLEGSAGLFCVYYSSIGTEFRRRGELWLGSALGSLEPHLEQCRVVCCTVSLYRLSSILLLTISSF